jgi:ligand-binding sensor domain-containing protein/signal transduction histidine kinase
LRRIIALLFAIACATLTCVHAQNYYFKHFRVDNGLSHNTVYCILQDKMGFVWIGTKDGLNRFDGTHFKIFRNKDFDSAAIGPNFINCLYEDPKGQLWVGTQRGLYLYDVAHERFHLLDGIQLGAIRHILIDHTGDLWFISGLKLYCYPADQLKKNSGKLTLCCDATSICQTKEGSIWIASWDGLLRKYIPSTHSFRSFDLFRHSPPSSSKWINELFDTGKGYLFVGTPNQGIKLFNLESLTYKDLIVYNADKTEIYVRDFERYNDDEYWIATESGIYIYNWSNNTFKNITKQFNNPYSLSDNAVYSLHKDKEGGIWVGTFFGGVNYYSPPYNWFEKYFPDNGKNAIKGNAVREICEDQKGHLWIGTEDGGLNRLDKKTGSIVCYNPTGAKGSISYSNIHGILPDGEKLWIGTFEHGLDVMDINSGKVIRHYGTNTQNLNSNFIVTLYKTREGTLLAGTSVGLRQYDPKSDRFMAVPEVPANNFISHILQDSEGTIWVSATGIGVFYYNPVTGINGNIRYEPHNVNSLSGDIINNIFEDSAGNLWFASEGSGITVYNRKTKKFKRITSKDGLPSDFVFKILEDAHKNLWISTTRGLVCFHPANNKLEVFTKANGLLTDQFNYNSGYKDSSGRMYFGSVRGLISFHPDQFQSSDYPPPVYITGLQINNQETGINIGHSPLKQAITLTKELTLSYDQSSFSLDFAALSFTFPEMTQYAYQLEGLDKDWTYLQTNRKVYFTDLSPGTYTFKVKSTNSQGIWNNQITMLKIIITPPFWQSTWAYLLYLISILGILYIIIREYHYRIEEKNRRKLERMQYEKEKEIYRAKIDFFTNVAHEIRTPLTLIQGPMEKVIDRTEGIKEIKDSLRIMEQNTNRLVELTDQLLDLREVETDGFRLHFSRINISELINNSYINFQELAIQKNIDLSLHLPQTPLITLADEDALQKILNNLFSNAIKYAKQKASVRLLPFSNENQTFTIEFKNDGYLIPEHLKEKIFEPFFRIKETSRQKGTGLGLSLSRSLAELHNGTLYFKAENHMNVFVLDLPLSQPKETPIYHN